MADQVRLSCGSEEERRIDTRGLTRDLGKLVGEKANA